jgi:hypothetical protein
MWDSHAGCLACAAFTRGNTTIGIWPEPIASQICVSAWLSSIPKASFATVLAVAGTTAKQSAGGCRLDSPGSRGAHRTGSPVASASLPVSPTASSQTAAVGVSVTATVQPSVSSGATICSRTCSAPPAPHTTSPNVEPVTAPPGSAPPSSSAGTIDARR